MKMVHGLKMRASKLNSITFAIILFILAFIADAKTLKVDTLTPSVTDGNLLLQRNGTGEVTFGDYSGFCKFASGSPTCYANIDLTSHVTGILPIANGGTGTSSTTFVNAATNVTGVLPIANGGTGSASQNFVDLTTNQSIAGDKTFSGATTFSSDATFSSTAFVTGLLTASSAITFAEIATPSTPSSGIKVYAKSDNKLYQLTDDGTEKKLGSGGGGEAGINFIADGSFEDSTLNPDSDGGGTESYQTYTTDADLYSESNLQYFRVAYTGLSAADTYVRDSFARTLLDDKQGFFSIWIKANADDFKVCVRVDDATFAAACDSALEHTIIGDSTWRKYEIPFVFGSATVQYEIYNESYTGDVNIEIDKVYVGTVPDGYIQTVGQASFVGSLTYQVANCLWADFSASWAGYPVDSDCTASNITGNVLAPASKTPSIRIPNARIDGYYKVVWQGVLIGGSASACKWSLSSSSSYENQGVAYVDTNGQGANGLTGNFKFTTSGTKVISIIEQRASGSGNCEVYGTDVTPNKFTVHFFPDSEANIVTQSTELDASTTNIFSAQLDANSAVTQADTFGIIGGGADCGTGCITVTFTGLTVAPICTATTDSSVAGGTIIGFRSATGLNIYTQIGNTLTNLPAYITCQKAGADVNKSAAIIGKFENINSSELCSARYTQGTQTVNNEVVEFTTQDHDNCVAYNTSNGRYTIPTGKSGKYLITAKVLPATSVAFTIMDIRVNGTAVESVYHDTAATNEEGGLQITGMLDLSAGDYVDINVNFNASTNLAATERYNTFSIQQLPDTESIIKNLNDNNNFECQTTFLTSAVTSDTNPISDLTRSNLTVGKKYKIILKPVTLWQNTTTGWYEFNAINNSEVVCRSQNSGVKVTNDNVGSTQSTCYFTAAATSLTFQTSGMAANMTLSDGSDNRTFISLCELPDNTIINSVKFD